MVAAAYIRVSSDKSDVNRQRESVLAFASQNGQTIDHLFEDSEGRNPRHRAAERKDFQRLLKAVESGLVKTIIVDSQDRFGVKDAFEWGKFASLLREHDCRLLDSTGRELTADDDGSVLTSVVGALTSKREQREKAHRNISGKIRYAKLGEYQGGYPPYGMDVVCFGPDGVEKWRTLYVGQFNRFKVYPDGKRERFQGKNVTPAKDSTDTLRYRPSIERERIKTVKQIFKWYATEDISPQQIANRLNDLKISSIFGPAWYKQTIRALLRNPVYLGLPAWNKRAGSEFVEYVDGQTRDIKGKSVRGRRRKPADYIQPDKPEFKAIIDKETWADVQRRIADTTTGHRAPHTADLWLRPFVICGRCGKPMHSTNGRSTKGLWKSYFCGTYNRFGPKNPTGCHCHRVRHDRLEQIVLQYLNDVEPRIAAVLNATQNDDAETLMPMLEGINGAGKAIKLLGGQMMDFVEQHGKLGKRFKTDYSALHDKLRPGFESRLAAKRAELDRLLDGFIGLSDRMKPAANQKMEALQDEIDALERQTTNLAPAFDNAIAELLARDEALGKAKQAIRGDGEGRRKADALSKVVKEIRLHFRHVEAKRRKPTDKPKNGISRLERVEIVPVSGCSVFFRIGGEQGHG